MSRAFREISEALILALIVFLVIQGSVRNFKVDGSSMLPSLETGQYLLVNKLVYFRLDTSRLSRVIPFLGRRHPNQPLSHPLAETGRGDRLSVPQGPQQGLR